MHPTRTWVLFVLGTGTLSYASGAALDVVTQDSPLEQNLSLRVGLMLVCALVTFALGVFLLTHPPSPPASDA